MGVSNAAPESARHVSVPVDRQQAVGTAWLLSAALHTGLLVTLALCVNPAGREPEVEPSRTAGIAIVQRTASQMTYFSEGEQEAHAPAVADAALESGSRPTSLTEWPIEPAISLPATGDVTADIGAHPNFPADGFMRGNSSGRQAGGVGTVPGGQARTSVFGAQGAGTKFVYVFDRSASMHDYQGRPLAAAKAQLLASLNDLDRVHQFQIVFYNERPTVFNPDHPRPPSILFASDEHKRLARLFVEGIHPAGGTHHMEALRLAVGMRPDVIFFLTDAGEPQLTGNELSDLRRRNRRDSIIHTIEFGVGPVRDGENFLKRLARDNGGQHVYVDISQLPSAAGS